MKIKYHDKGYVTMSGSSLLSQIQNRHTPSLDLLIRESIQNSLDAVKPDSKKVTVSIKTGLFLTENLCPFFEGIQDRLKSRYPGTNSFISIQDTGTTGLTGPLSLSQVQNSQYGNLQKLIYQVAKPQEHEGSGGSWGIGKTVYFRIGNGLVIYYSRIFNTDTGRYEERMAATLVESEKKPNLLDADHSGIAWWGKPDLSVPGGNGSQPIVDSPEIQSVLSAFGLEQMTGEKTGTLIIIPYVNADRLLTETVVDDASENAMLMQKPYWKSSLNQFFRVGLQKWYAPRLYNPQYQGAWLDAYVNGREITTDDFLPFFLLIQNLYNTDPDHPGSFKNRELESEPVNLRSEFSSGACSGILSYAMVTEEDLEMGIPDHLPSPYTDIDKDLAETAHEPILAYTRKPGMIVSYETDSDWTRTMPKTPSDEFIVAVFKSDRNAILKDSSQSTSIRTLEDYLRQTENADHMSWQDINLNSRKSGIVTKIRNNIRNKISSRFKDQPVHQTQTKNLSLGRKLGKMFLPPDSNNYWDRRMGGTEGPGGSGGTGRSGTSGEPGGGAAASRGFGMKIDGEPEYKEGLVYLPLLLSFGTEKEGVLEIRLKTETGTTGAEKWITDMKKPFPASIYSLEIFEISAGKRGGAIPKKKRKIKELFGGNGSLLKSTSTYQDIRFTFEKTRDDRSTNKIRIQVPEANYYQVRLILAYSVTGFEGVLSFSKGQKNGGDEE